MTPDEIDNVYHIAIRQDEQKAHQEALRQQQQSPPQSVNARRNHDTSYQEDDEDTFEQEAPASMVNSLSLEELDNYGDASDAGSMYSFHAATEQFKKRANGAQPEPTGA
jgi:hypothetical protein